MKAVILAGGKGTRLSPVTNDLIPKSMVKIRGIPLLEHQIMVLKRYYIRELIIITGFLHEKIAAYFGNGEVWGVSITYITEDSPRGTGGSLPLLTGLIDDDFLLLFGDLIFDISVSKMLAAHRNRNALVTLFAHPNSHPADSDIVLVDKKNRVTGYSGKKEKREGFYRNLVNAGIYIIKADIFTRLPKKEKMDLEQEIIFPQCGSGSVFAYISPEYVKDAGTPERLEQVEHDMASGIILQRNLDNPQKCIFLDRDGTLNRYRDLIYQTSQMELEETAAAAVRSINSSGYLAVVITNQPVIARGLCSEKNLEDIHNKLETLLGEQGAYLDGIFYCPHHPDRGYEGENADYKILCRCRKPAVGMIEESAGRFNISLGDSFIIGDSTTDIQTGKNAGIKTILVETGLAGSDKKYDASPDCIYTNIGEAVEYILRSHHG